MVVVSTPSVREHAQDIRRPFKIFWGLLVGLDIQKLQTFSVKIFWHETWSSWDGTFSSEFLYDREKSKIPKNWRLQWFCLTPFAVQK